ncbi:MAG: coproporphyrinogen dehydrogenase HemZ [Selenomonadaceae bacterium]|nr:coproporphyrinogen dehydrogenase HemZ [Selenomonadaceae bacterium]
MRIKNLKLNSDDQVITKITGEVLRSFHIDIVDDYADFEEFQISNDVTGDIVKTRLVVKSSKSVKILSASEIVNPEEKFGAEVHRLIKKNLYRILTGDLKLHGVPYGIMHGVRPTKIVHRWLKSGFATTSRGVIDRDKIARRLRADYLVSYEKALLLTEVALRQLPILNSGDEKSISVYIGIPFCVTRCLYCSFPSNVLPDDEKVAEFMEVLTKDINAAAAEIKRYGFKVQTIYIGGGTPTSLPINFFTEMLEKVTNAFYDGNVKEFTVECGRPDTIDDAKIEAMRKFHVNRVCVNPQTMQDKTLEKIGRKHTAAQIVTAFEKLRKASNWKINMDLILGLPGENFDDVTDSLNKVLQLNPDDVTLHALALKRGSQMQTQIADKFLALEDFELPSDEEVKNISYTAERILRGKGYAPYYLYRQGYIVGGIENVGYCKRGAECIYNVNIIGEQQVILGVGAAASTKVPDNKEMRLQTSFHAKDLTTYLRDIDKYIENRSKVLAEVYTPIEIPAEEIITPKEEIPAQVENDDKKIDVKPSEKKSDTDIIDVADVIDITTELV